MINISVKKLLIFSSFLILIFLIDLEGLNLEQKFTSSNVFIDGDSDFKLIEENYDFSNQSGGPSFFEYDQFGKLEKKFFVRSDGLKTVTSYTYNREGVLLNSIRDYGKEKKDLFSYTYNKNRKLIKRLMKRSTGIEGHESYKYNEKGHLVEAEWKNFDSWLSGIITFKSDKNGKLINGVFKGDKFNADIEFIYNFNNNLEKIRWRFSFGKTQTYTFKYKRVK